MSEPVITLDSPRFGWPGQSEPLPFIERFELNLLAPGPVYGLSVVALVGCLIGPIPGIRRHHCALIDGMTVRL